MRCDRLNTHTVRTAAGVGGLQTYIYFVVSASCTFCKVKCASRLLPWSTRVTIIVDYLDICAENRAWSDKMDLLMPLKYVRALEYGKAGWVCTGKS